MSFWLSSSKTTEIIAIILIIKVGMYLALVLFMMRYKNNKKIRPFQSQGYSLLEIIVSVAILALVMLLVLQVMTVMLRIERKSRDYVYTISLAQGFMEKIKEAPYTSIKYGTTLPPSNLVLPKEGKKISIDEIDPVGYIGPLEGYFSVYIDEKNDSVADSDYKLVKVTVSWATPGRTKEQHAAEVVTRIYPYSYY